MSVPRTLIWTPTPAAELQLAMHRAGVGPAAVVPVPSGTVLLLSPAASLPAAVWIATECQKVAGRAVVLCWDDIAAFSYSILGKVGGFWGWGEDRAVKALHLRVQHPGAAVRAVASAVWLPVGWFRKPSRVDKAAGALSTVFGVDAADEQVKARVRSWERGGPDAITALLGAAGLHDVAQVVDLVHAGQAEPRVAALPAPVARPLMFMLLTSRALVRRQVRTKPINAVLPVIPVTQGAVPTEQPPA